MTLRGCVIRSRVIEGNYKDTDIEVEIGDSGATTIVKMNGKKINNCEALYLKIAGYEQPRLTLVLTKEKR